MNPVITEKLDVDFNQPQLLEVQCRRCGKYFKPSPYATLHRQGTYLRYIKCNKCGNKFVMYPMAWERLKKRRKINNNKV
jgi:ribosomal protein S27E